MDRGTGVVGGPASAFLSGTDGCVDYFDCDDPCDYEEWGAWDDSAESGTCGDTCQSDVIDDRTVFSWGWSVVRSVAPESTVIRDADRSPSEPISGDTKFS